MQAACWLGRWLTWFQVSITLTQKCRQSMRLSATPLPNEPWCESCASRDRWYTGRTWMWAHAGPQSFRRYLMISA